MLFGDLIFKHLLVLKGSGRFSFLLRYFANVSVKKFSPYVIFRACIKILLKLGPEEIFFLIQDEKFAPS